MGNTHTNSRHDLKRPLTHVASQNHYHLIAQKKSIPTSLYKKIWRV